MKTSDFENKFQNYVDLTSWIDYFLVTEIGKHIDAYKLSFYMHKKKITNGGKIHFGPLWDFNLAFGNFDFACSPDPQGWTYEFQGTCDNSHPFWIKKMTNIPEVSNQINCRWNGLRDGPLHTDSLMDFLNLKELEMGNAPKRNFERWEILGEYVWPNDYVGETYDEEITFLKNWLTTRLEWMDDNMLGDCSLASIEKQDEVYSLAGAYPNPATDYFYLETQLANYQNARLKMFNSLGQEVLSMNINNSIEKVHLGNLPKGIYNFKISVGGLEKSSSNKLIVQ
ncbi:CotH kinase family protein [Bacteroidia bacterium]|nr:CotH kinase family protein [Bacteroidia bacterium]